MTNLWYANYRKLSSGDRGQDVKQLQIKLQAILAMSPALIPNGIFGLHTKAAVINYQRAMRLIEDGIVGPLTYARVFRRNYKFAPVTPLVVTQGSTWTCWAACLESVLGRSWVGRRKMSVKKLQEKYKDHVDNNGAIKLRGFLAAGNDFRFKEATDYFRNNDHRIYAEKLLKLLNARRPLILLNLSPASMGSGHARVVYGVLAKKGAINVMLMDPMVGYTEVPLSSLQPTRNSHISIFAAKEVHIPVVSGQ